MHVRSPRPNTYHLFMDSCSQFCLTITELSLFQTSPCVLRVCSTSLLKTLWEKEKLLFTNYSSFSHVFKENNIFGNNIFQDSFNKILSQQLAHDKSYIY